MKITREVNGISMEFELTFSEIREAYLEEQRNCDMEDVECHIEDYEIDGETEEFEEKFGIDVATFRAECIPDATDQYRRWRDRGDEYRGDFFWDTLEESFKEAARKYRERQKSA